MEQQLAAANHWSAHTEIVGAEQRRNMLSSGSTAGGQHRDSIPHWSVSHQEKTRLIRPNMPFLDFLEGVAGLPGTGATVTGCRFCDSTLPSACPPARPLPPPPPAAALLAPPASPTAAAAAEESVPEAALARMFLAEPCRHSSHFRVTM